MLSWSPPYYLAMLRPSAPIAFSHELSLTSNPVCAKTHAFFTFHLEASTSCILGNFMTSVGTTLSISIIAMFFPRQVLFPALKVRISCSISLSCASVLPREFFKVEVLGSHLAGSKLSTFELLGLDAKFGSNIRGSRWRT